MDIDLEFTLGCAHDRDDEGGDGHSGQYTPLAGDEFAASDIVGRNGGDRGDVHPRSRTGRQHSTSAEILGQGFRNDQGQCPAIQAGRVEELLDLGQASYSSSARRLGRHEAVLEAV